MSYEDLAEENTDILYELFVEYRTETPPKNWCIIQKSKYGEPDLVRINYEGANGICVTEYGFGECTSTIDYSKVLMFGHRAELQVILNNYLKIRESSQAAKDTME